MFTLAYDERYKAVLVRFTGVFSSEDVAALDAAGFEFTARKGPSHWLLDFTAVESVALPMSKLMLRGRQPPISPGHERVYIVQSPQTLEMARAFNAQQALAGSSGLHIVTTLEEACALLGLDDPRFDPVSDTPGTAG
jgi:hypothetical protein